VNYVLPAPEVPFSRAVIALHFLGRMLDLSGSKKCASTNAETTHLPDVSRNAVLKESSPVGEASSTIFWRISVRACDVLLSERAGLAG
jgi:hypothetical protein